MFAGLTDIRQYSRYEPRVWTVGSLEIRHGHATRKILPASHTCYKCTLRAGQGVGVFKNELDRNG